MSNGGKQGRREKDDDRDRTQGPGSKSLEQLEGEVELSQTMCKGWLELGGTVLEFHFDKHTSTPLSLRGQSINGKDGHGWRDPGKKRREPNNGHTTMGTTGRPDLCEE